MTSEFKEGDLVKPRGKFKKVVDFLATSDKETMRILLTFFDGDKPDPVGDAKKLIKPKRVSKVYRDSLEVAIQRGEFFWEEKQELFERSGDVEESA